ncbi:hypothetical protein BH11BAC3_BH11BAC3_27280 [soil metagenome]
MFTILKSNQIYCLNHDDLLLYKVRVQQYFLSSKCMFYDNNGTLILVVKHNNFILFKANFYNFYFVSEEIKARVSYKNKGFNIFYKGDIYVYKPVGIIEDNAQLFLNNNKCGQINCEISNLSEGRWEVTVFSEIAFLIFSAIHIACDYEAGV